MLSALTAAFLVGCGGGGGSSSSSGTGNSGTTTPAQTSTDVTVERGAVYGATVTDANGQVATQIAGKNVYTFATTPVYPITASGGIIDIDNNGIDEGDIELTTVLTSYSTVVTPITTYLGNPATDSGKAKLAKLKEIAGVTSDDDFFKKAPSELVDNIGTNVLVLTNALFDIMNDGDTSNDDFVSSYDNSEFKTKFDNLKTEAEKYTDKKEMAKALEEKVVTNLGLAKLETKDLSNTTTTTTLKVADLKRFVSFDGSDWYDDNTVADGKITFKPYSFKGSAASPNGEWVLEEENDYVTITPDATNPYKLSYVDPITKEEGTLILLSTKQVANYSDLYKTKTKREVTKMGTELDWYRWDWINPTNWDNTTQKSTPITNIDELYTYFNQSVNAIVTKETDRVIYTSLDGKEHSYYRLVQENGNYYIEATDLEDVGYTEQEAIFTGTSLDEFIANIKAPAPVFTSNYIVSVPENQTNAYTATVTDSLKVTYSLNGTDASLFAIDSETGVVTFVNAPDYESTTHRPFYNIIVIAKNSAGKYTKQGVSIQVTNVDEATTTPTTPVSTTSFVSGKTVIVSGTDGQMTASFGANGTYSESYGNGSCTGLWKDFGNNKIGVTCEDVGTTAIPTDVASQTTNILQFASSTPAVNDTVTVTEPGKTSYSMTITSISDIAK